MLGAPDDTTVDPALRKRVAPLAALQPGATAPAPTAAPLRPTAFPSMYGGLPPMVGPKAPIAGAPGAAPMPTVAPKAPLPTSRFDPATQGLPRPQQPPPGGLSVTPGVAPRPPQPMVLPPIAGGGDFGPGGNVRPNVGPLPPSPDSPEALSDFGPGNDLRYTQINPLNDARTGKLSDYVDASAAKLNSSPDLAQAGLDKLAELRQQNSEDERAGIQNIGRANAALGRLGSGMVTGQLGDLEALLRSRTLAAEKGLAGDLTTQEAADRRANTGTLAALQDQVFGQGTQRRNELRSERGYETGVAENATDRAIQQRLLQEDLDNSQFGRKVTAAQLGLEGAGQLDQGAQDASGSAADLAGTLAMYNARGLPGSAPAATPTTPAPTGYKWIGGRLVPIDQVQQTY